MISGIKLQGQNGKFTLPMFSHIYHLTTVEMSNKKGTWSTWSVSKVGPVKNQQVYELAKNFADSVSKGDVQAKHGEESEDNKVPF
jgi:hypothetical protein